MLYFLNSLGIEFQKEPMPLPDVSSCAIAEETPMARKDKEKKKTRDWRIYFIVS
jgi:hypothetical protein